MSIFGQVWLWSVAAFLIGVLLTWLVLVRPAQARNRMLERRLLAAAPGAPERQFPLTTRSVEPEPASLRKKSEPAPPRSVQPAREEHTEPRWFERDNFGEPVSLEEEAKPAPATEFV